MYLTCKIEIDAFYWSSFSFNIFTFSMGNSSSSYFHYGPLKGSWETFLSTSLLKHSFSVLLSHAPMGHLLHKYHLCYCERRRQWQPTPVLWPGKSHGWRNLVDYSPWGCWVRHDWATSFSLFTFVHWKRKWQPTPVFLPGESQGRGSLMGCRLWGHTELDRTEAI